MTGLWSSVVGGLLGKVAPKVADYYLQKQEQKAQYKLEVAQQNHQIEMERLRGKAAWEVAKTQRAEASEGRDHEWELQSLMLHSKGYKDEAVLAIVSIPAILSFIPTGHVIVADGFEALSGTPYWYQLLLVAIYFAVYGIRYHRRNQIREFYEQEDANKQTLEGKA